jgi:hypothetical protein
MKMDHPPLMKENTPSHAHNIDHVEKNYGGDGHKAAHEFHTPHQAGHKKHHEHVMAMCGGGMAKGR